MVGITDDALLAPSFYPPREWEELRDEGMYAVRVDLAILATPSTQPQATGPDTQTDIQGKFDSALVAPLIGDLDLEVSVSGEGDIVDVAVPVDPTKRGGVDFDPKNWALEEEGVRQNFIHLNEPLINFPKGSIEGVMPVITDIIPIVDFSVLLGIKG